MKIAFYYLLFTCFTVTISAQNIDSTESVEWDFTAYGDMYYTFDDTEPANNERQYFLYNYKRHNEFNINLALIHAKYTYKGLKLNLGLQSGTFPQYNMAHELPVIRNIYEANINYEFTRMFDFSMGMFPSHLGFEGVRSSGNDVLTHSIVSENTPYYVTGARLGFRPFEKLKINALLTNGWQVITETPGNTSKALGLQVEYKPSDKIHINYSNIYSNEAPDSIGAWILYHNLYGIIQIHKKIRLTAGVDYGSGTLAANNKTASVVLGTIIARYQFHSKWAIAARGEFYEDNNGLIIQPPVDKSFTVNAYSGNIDFSPNKNILFRIEGRQFTSPNTIFREDKDNPKVKTHFKFVDKALAVTFAVQVKFD